LLLESYVRSFKIIDIYHLLLYNYLAN